MSNKNNISFFFIIGRARSGTTLLRTLFDAHPNVKIPLESPLILELAKDWSAKKKWSKEDLLSFFEQLIQVKDFEKWVMDQEKLKELLLSHPKQSGFKDLINTLYLQSPSIFDKAEILALGDKNPVYSVHIDSVFKLYPEAKYIHLQRDYRAHILSMQKAGLYANDVLPLAFRWKYSAKKIARLKKEHPSSFYEIKYEDLVLDPETHLKQLCTFLEIPYRAEMLDFHKKTRLVEQEDADGKIEKHHQRIFQPIDATRVDSWKNEMDKADIRIADFVVGHLAEDEGYTRVFTKFDPGLALKIWPGILYQKLFYAYRNIYNKLPGFYKRWRSGKR